MDTLAFASPATVSRLGMVFMEPGALGVQPLIDSWFVKLGRKLPVSVNEAFINKMRSMISTLLEPCLEFVRKNLKETISTINASLCSSLLRLVDCLIAPYLVAQEVQQEEGGLDVEMLPSLAEHFFLFALVWSVGATSDADGRRKFDQFLRKQVESAGDAFLPLPAGGMLFDYKFDTSKQAWVSWMDDAPKYNPGNGKSIDVLVPTLDTVRYSFLSELLLSNGCHMLATGSTGIPRGR